jgi:hypothetical protein
MAQVDWSDPNETDLKSGIYLAQVEKAEEKPSSKGDPMFKVTLKAVAFRTTLCDDFIMLGGKGRGMGQAKLKALGFGPDVKEIHASELVGQRVYARVAFQEYDDKRTGTKRRSLKVVNVEGSYCGYWPESEKPEGVLEPDPAAQAADESDPF